MPTASRWSPSTSNDIPPDMRQFSQRHGFSFPLLQDTLGITRERYAVVGTPTSVLIDADGHTLSSHVGARTPDELAGDFAMLDASMRAASAPDR
ncbi:MAG: TlpA disulfide reductase family protein [Propionivibrio sp.]